MSKKKSRTAVTVIAIIALIALVMELVLAFIPVN